jgi:hypothetical protein
LTGYVAGDHLPAVYQGFKHFENYFLIVLGVFVVSAIGLWAWKLRRNKARLWQLGTLRQLGML